MELFEFIYTKAYLFSYLILTISNYKAGNRSKQHTTRNYLDSVEAPAVVTYHRSSHFTEYIKPACTKSGTLHGAHVALYDQFPVVRTILVFTLLSPNKNRR